MIKKIFIRDEINIYEQRTPIIPNDIKLLLNNDFIVYVEKSNKRIFTDIEYINNGAIVTDKKWYDDEFKDALIVGIKTFNEFNKLNNHKHVNFSHCYKKQKGSYDILQSYKISNSVLYDFEYFKIDNKRIISFGKYAGMVGCLLGILQYLTKVSKGYNIINLKCWNSIDDMIKDFKLFNCSLLNFKIGVIGPYGQCGNGVINILNILNAPYDLIQKNTPKNNLQDYDILFNCILLDDANNEIWFDDKTIFEKYIVIVDISMDYTKNNNPIKLYDNAMDWKNPILTYNSNVDLVLIDNLPSLLPYDSSIHFSSLFVKILLEYNNDINKIWHSNKLIFFDQIARINT